MIKKPIALLLKESTDEGEHSLKRSLGPVNLILIGIGIIIGAGLFSLTGIAAGQHSGPAVTISFLIAALGCTFAALCYAEFSAMIPVAGSAYTYSYATMGTQAEFKAMLDLVAEHKIVPVIDEAFPLAEAAKASAKMESSKQFGKLVVRVS